MPVNYRLADDGDAARIADLHARSWRSAYRGHLPDAYLDNDVFDDRAEVWQLRFRDRAGTLTILAERGGALIGFVHSMLDHEPVWGTLLDNLHVDPALKRGGIGRQLMRRTAEALSGAARSDRLHLWVLEANAPARRFYDALGGEIISAGIATDGGGSLPALMYGWVHADVLCTDAGRPSAS